MATFKSRDIGWLLGFLAASFGAAGLGSALTLPALGPWYRTLRKPKLTPPDRVFGPVWTALYLQMAVAAWLVRRGMTKQPDRGEVGQVALVAWAAQLLLNVTWSAVFFARRSLAGGLVVIVLLWAAIAATAALAARVARLGGALLVPYLAWVSFATYLNARLLQLNRRK